jgi:hypothetical protein
MTQVMNLCVAPEVWPLQHKPARTFPFAPWHAAAMGKPHGAKRLANKNTMVSAGDVRVRRARDEMLLPE